MDSWPDKRLEHVRWDLRSCGADFFAELACILLHSIEGIRQYKRMHRDAVQATNCRYLRKVGVRQVFLMLYKIADMLAWTLISPVKGNLVRPVHFQGAMQHARLPLHVAKVQQQATSSVTTVLHVFWFFSLKQGQRPQILRLEKAHMKQVL